MEYNVTRFIQLGVNKKIQKVGVKYGLFSQIVNIIMELVVVVQKSPKEKPKRTKLKKNKGHKQKDITKGKQSESKRKMKKFKFEGQTKISRTVCSCR